MSRATWGLLAVSVLLAIAVPTTVRAHDAGQIRDTAQMVSAARRMSDPVPMHALVLHHDCNGTTLIRCGWTTEQDVDRLARQVNADLTRSAGRPARTQCFDVRGRAGADLRSCLVQVGDSDHAATIFLDPYVRTVDDETRLLGTQVVVTAG